MSNQFVVFELGNENYGVNIASVESIIKMQAITKIPHSKDFVAGVTNLRGKVLPVVELRKRFGLPEGEAGKNNRIIIISVNEIEVGMIVDGVSEVLTIQEENVVPTPPITATIDSSFITGIAKVEQRLIILLDLGKVLSTSEQQSLAEMAV